MSKTFGSTEVQIILDETTIEKIATKVTEAITRKLPANYNANTTLTKQDNIHSISIDERIFDTGVSSEGIEKARDITLANTEIKQDNISEAKDKLKSLKRNK